ncbi:MAG TPA: Ig-like domain repeat protein [Solirubrobacteraceae bacterium]|nr:Ig-like domain repeat protein [Solirubrobacteraceae bacterium]
MPCRRSLIGLLSAIIALLAVPAIASAQAPGCTGTDPVPSGGPDVTAPNNTTALANPGWYTTPYTVTLHGDDAESGLLGLQWCLNNGAFSDAFDGDDITIATSGVWTLNTRAVDNEGNVSAWRPETVRVDLAKPIDMTDAGGTGWHNAPTDVIVLASDMDSGLKQVWWQLDGGLAQSGANGTSVPIAADGTHTLTTWAEDNAGNLSVPRTHTVRVDTVTPTDTTAAPGGWQTAPLPVAVTGTDGHSGVTQVIYSVDGGAPITAASPATVTVSGDGDHVLTTKVRDAAGNESGWKTTNSHIDTTAPDNQTDTAGSGWRAADYSVMVRGADSGSGLNDVQWRVNGGAITTGASPQQAIVTGNGDQIFETRVRDVAGNASAWRVEHVRIDKVLPTNTTTAPLPSNPNPYSVTVTGTDADSGIARVDWQVDGGAIQQGVSGDPVTINGFGTHTLKTRVADNAGNETAWRTDTVVISGSDTTRPTDTTATVAPGWHAEPLTVDVTATDAGGAGVDAVMWRISQFGAPTGSAPIQTVSGDHASVTFQDEGRWLLETRARDRSGNLSLQWRQHYINLDFTVPTDTTDIPATWQNSRTFSWSGDDALSGVDTFEYMVNAGAPQTAVVGATVTVPSDGIFVIDHRVLDAAGQTSGWTTDTLKVDTVLPANTTAVPASTWRATALSLPLTGTDDRSGLDKIQWRLNGGTITDGGPAVIDADGEYTLETRAVDAAGNETAWRSDTVRVDVTDPVNDTPAASTDWRSTDYVVHVEGSDGDGSGVAGVEVKIDGGAVSTDPDVTVAGDGEHTLETRIVDNVGHTSEWRSETIKIDSADPTASVTCPAGWNNHAVSCTATANDGLSGISDLTASVDGGAFAAVTGNAVPVSTDGDHTVALKAVDGAGNDVTSAAVHVKIDRTLPRATLSCAAASTPTGYVCRTAGSDALSGLASLTYSLNGAAWRAVPAGGAISVAHGTIRVRALDVAGNQYLTSTLTLAQRKPPAPPTPPAETPTMRSSSVPVYLGGHTDDDSMIGAMLAARSANGTVSVDLRPLAVGRGTYKVTIVLRAGKAERTVSKTYKVKRGDALRRINASLADAGAKATVALTVKKKHGRKWRKYATAKVVLAK